MKFNALPKFAIALPISTILLSVSLILSTVSIKLSPKLRLVIFSCLFWFESSTAQVHSRYFDSITYNRFDTLIYRKLCSLL